MTHSRKTQAQLLVALEVEAALGDVRTLTGEIEGFDDLRNVAKVLARGLGDLGFEMLLSALTIFRPRGGTLSWMVPVTEGSHSALEAYFWHSRLSDQEPGSATVTEARSDPFRGGRGGNIAGGEGTQGCLLPSLVGSDKPREAAKSDP